MKIITDLMEAYSDHVKLPLLLVNLNGEIELSVSANNDSSPQYLTNEKLRELKEIAIRIVTPTIISVDSPQIASSTNLYYIITPRIKAANKTSFLIAGPFQLSANCSSPNNSLLTLPIAFTEEEVDCRINKIINLVQLLDNKIKVECNSSVLEQLTDLLQIIGELDGECKELDYQQYIVRLLEKLIKFDSFDFLGLAMKAENGMFVVKYITGDEKLNELVGKRFYMGEGLIGKAVLLGKDFYWSRGIDIPRREFLHRYGIYPEHLFGITCNQMNSVEEIFFGGNFRDDIISDQLLKLLKSVMQIIVHKREMNIKLANSGHIQSIFINWLDLVDITNYIHDKKQVLHKILDLCQTLNNCCFSCFSTPENELVYLGESLENGLAVHHQMVEQLNQHPNTKLWVNSPFIHFILQSNHTTYGFFTVEFQECTDLKHAKIILGMLDKLLSEEEHFDHFELDNGASEKIKLLHESMKEMNIEQYQMTELTLLLANSIFQAMQLTEDKKQILQNVCKVMPYSYNYLKDKLVGTNEWKVLEEMYQLLKGDVENLKRLNEIEALAYIYSILYQDNNRALKYISDPNLKKICRSAYEAIASGKVKPLKAISISKKSKDSLSAQAKDEEFDLKSVISSFPLTSREQEVLYLVLEGLNNQEVGDYLNISVHTVKNHVTNIFKKLNVSDRIQAMSKIYRIKYDEHNPPPLKLNQSYLKKQNKH